MATFMEFFNRRR